jgi:hypothetical protein
LKLEEGYEFDFNLMDEKIELKAESKSYHPDDFEVDKVLRFEGMSNPADNTLLIALEANDGNCGTLVMSYGGDHFQDIDTLKEIEGNPRV